MMPKRWTPTIFTTTRLYTRQTTHGLVVKNMQRRVVLTIQKLKKHTIKTKIHVLSPTLHLNKKDKMLYVRLQFDKYENHAILDTGAIQSAMSEAKLRTITTALSRSHPSRITYPPPPPRTSKLK